MWMNYPRSMGHENNTVCTISNMGRYSSYSNLGANMKRFKDKYCMVKEMCIQLGSACVKVIKM